MKKPTLALSIIMFLYAVLAAVATWRAINIQVIDLFSFGVIPVLIGLALRTSWAGIAFKVYLAIQTLGLTALAGTAIIAYQVSPEDVKVVFNNHEIPVPLIAITAGLLLAFQFWVAFSTSTKGYLEGHPSAEKK
ncbi:hypothetical protein [Shewanella woodyi]|uniref:Uncharacterized protein n=1 Tax=Shewanella woodyi (strain ATCC 51908 / MS32) TaxID=392500 RepID=B1KJD2_SHEWM|nr:hypothetical protein [Shewanella woodyi]ACA88604.1 conserved hypothetical protein [Shewanella woodyi ATCC 51908]